MFIIFWEFKYLNTFSKKTFSTVSYIMTSVQDSIYKAIEELLMSHNGSVRDIAQVIMSYWFIKFPECLRNELDLHYPEFQLEMEVGLKTNHVGWDHLESKEAKLSVGLFLCNSLVSDTSIVAMIILKKLFLNQY